jgi:D-alanyl-D-alanine carboxypeptidase
MSMRFRMSVMAAAIASLAVLALAAPAGAAPNAERRLANSLEKLVAFDGGPPGASAVLRRGDRERMLTAGVINLDTGKPFAPNKLMRIASVSKAFSGAVGLSLVDDGVLSLDDTIADRLPSLPPAWGAVTLRQVMSHTGGLPSFTKDPNYLAQFAADPQDGSMTMPELVAFVADEPLAYPPGTSYEYSNTDNIVIALMAEAATGKPYTQLLSEQVTGPLGLRRTRLPTGFNVPEPAIHGYELFPTEDLTDCCAMAYIAASGGMLSTPRELTRFTRGYVGGELFGGSTRAAQFEFVPGGSSEPPGPGQSSGGLSLFRYRTSCGTVFGHTGNFPGYTQFTAATRSGRRVATVSANRQLAPDAGGQLAPEAFVKLRKTYRLAVCALLD